MTLEELLNRMNAIIAKEKWPYEFDSYLDYGHHIALYKDNKLIGYMSREFWNRLLMEANK